MTTRERLYDLEERTTNVTIALGFFCSADWQDCFDGVADLIDRRLERAWEMLSWNGDRSAWQEMQSLEAAVLELESALYETQRVRWAPSAN